MWYGGSHSETEKKGPDFFSRKGSYFHHTTLTAMECFVLISYLLLEIQEYVRLWSWKRIYECNRWVTTTTCMHPLNHNILLPLNPIKLDKKERMSGMWPYFSKQTVVLLINLVVHMYFDSDYMRNIISMN